MNVLTMGSFTSFFKDTIFLLRVKMYAPCKYSNMEFESRKLKFSEILLPSPCQDTFVH